MRGTRHCRKGGFSERRIAETSAAGSEIVA
jgi:hypothetical protein